MEMSPPWSTREGQNIFNTLWIDTLVGLAAVVQGETGCLFYSNTGSGCDGYKTAGSWGQLERQRGRKGDGKAGEESSGNAEFWLPLLAE